MTRSAGVQNRRSSPGRTRERTRRIYEGLAATNPGARIELTFADPLELLVATILAAQCTDRRVNEVTALLFRRYRTPRDYLAVPPAELEEAIRPTGFFRQKAKTLRAVMERLDRDFGGQVPSRMEDLLSLPGVGRKTANVILGNAFGVPGIVVDTHVARVSRRLGLTAEEKPDRIEEDLAALFPREEWTRLSHVLIFHGRYTCKARRPLCGECPVADLCPSREGEERS